MKNLPNLRVAWPVLLVSLLVSAASPARAAEPGYYAQPTLHGDRLVFVSEGDLWTVTLPAADAAQAGPLIAHRLTTSDGLEQRPVLSPDAQRIAFTAEYDGNTDVYVMDSSGGAPRRLTFHPAPDLVMGWSGDGNTINFRSSRDHPHGLDEAFRVRLFGGMPERFAFGECAQMSLSATGSRFVFTRWSNEDWTWKRYRGGAAPDIWAGDFNAARFRRLTDDPANDVFPMWMAGRVFFVSDRSGTANIYSESPEGGDLREHTQFRFDPGDPAALDGYDVRWPSRDAQRRGATIAFCQGGQLALLDVRSGAVRRLDVRLASDRKDRRPRRADPADTLAELALSPAGEKLAVGARGEAIVFDVETGNGRSLTRSPGAREWGLAFLGDDLLAMISDVTGDQQVAAVPVDGSDLPSMLTEDRETWLVAPSCSANGRWVAFADRDMRLHVLDMLTLELRQVDVSDVAEITDYRFSPDGRWLAYTKPGPAGTSTVMIHALRTGRNFPVSSGLHHDSEPRWDPAGRYLYMLSSRHLAPTMGEVDFDHVFVESRRVVAVPLATTTAPPDPELAAAAGDDLHVWAAASHAWVDFDDDSEEPGIVIDTEGLAERQFVLPLEGGRYRRLEAVRGGVMLLAAQPTESDDALSLLASADAKLVRQVLSESAEVTLADGVADYTVSSAGTTVAWTDGEAVYVKLAWEDDPREIDLSSVRLAIDVEAEWRQIFDEAWRLQRDFYWNANLGGVDWPAMREKYEPLLARVGTRGELNDLVGEMIGELGTSHAYVFGGDEPRQATPVSVGLLGADIGFESGVCRIRRIFRAPAWDADQTSPLGLSHLGVEEGAALLSINGNDISLATNVFELLEDQADRFVDLVVADDPRGAGRREVRVKAISAEQERELRYLAWVEDNRRTVSEMTEGAVGYLHLPDMGHRGLTMFARQFYPQVDRSGLVVDLRYNGGGFAGQMILQRLARRELGRLEPRQGEAQRYPRYASGAMMTAIINQHAGSEGDVFPALFRAMDLGPLVGSRTWGGTVAIRPQRLFVDLGLSTQPEFAWVGADGLPPIENVGVSPDVVVDITPTDRANNRDPQLEAAVEMVK